MNKQMGPTKVFNNEIGPSLEFSLDYVTIKRGKYSKPNRARLKFGDLCLLVYLDLTLSCWDI